MTYGSRRKCLGALATGLGGVLAAACGVGSGSDGGGATAGGPSRLSGALELWVGNRFDWGEPVTLGIIDDFRTKHPNLKVEVVVDAKETDGPVEKLTAAIVAGSAPDVAHVGPPFVKGFADRKWIAELDPYFKASRVLSLNDLFDAYQRDHRWLGKTYGITFGGDLRILYNNTRAWSSAGLDTKKPPANWDEWDDVIRKLLVKTSSGDIQRLGYNPAGQTTQGYLWAFWQLGGEIANEDTTRITLANGDAAVKAFEWMLRVTNMQGGRDAIGKFHVANGSAPATPHTANYSTLFINGNVGTFMQTFAHRNEVFKKDAPTLEFGWMDVPIPKGGKKANYGGGHAFALPTLSKNRDAGWAFMEHFSLPEMNTPFATRWDRVPMRKSVANSQAFQRGDPFLKDMVSQVPDRRFVLTSPYSQTTVSALYNQYINAVLDGKMSPKDAVTDWARVLQAEADKWAASKK